MIPARVVLDNFPKFIRDNSPLDTIPVSHFTLKKMLN